jgi:Na+/H+ antiporter NhaD/arsenite permease-like protein
MTSHIVEVPSLPWVGPFVVLLLCIALLPLIRPTKRWWEHNHNKLIVAIVLAIVMGIHYYIRDFGMVHGGHASKPGWPTVLAMLHHAVLREYVPFMVLLFSLYTISGGISLRGDIAAHPRTNTIILGIGALLASFVGTTGAAMLLIRPLLRINSERRHVSHTVIFFIFLVCNIGGCLLPIGDPPLFLGYLRGVPFLWTLQLWKEWLFCIAVLLVIYYVWDTVAWKREAPSDIAADETIREPLRLRGGLNFLWIYCVILAVAFLVPGQKLAGTSWEVPYYLREGASLFFVALAWLTTPKQVRLDNRFSFVAITEVAFLFIGIFICMQAPIEILKAKGPELGLHKPWHFFWATGTLSSFLDNAPTYAVYFATAGSLHESGMPLLCKVATATGVIPIPLLIAISLGSVFMGANTYIGNGPNFMVKSIAEQSGVKMPTFFGYMGYSIAILIPLFVVVTLLFMH